MSDLFILLELFAMLMFILVELHWNLVCIENKRNSSKSHYNIAIIPKNRDNDSGVLLDECEY